jgi:hypothetical protein
MIIIDQLNSFQGANVIVFLLYNSRRTKLIGSNDDMLHTVNG